MALITPSPLIETIKGKMGDMYIAQYGDKFHLKRHPHRKPAPPTQAQTLSREHLIGGNAYWKRIRIQPEMKAVYVMAGLVKGKRPNDLAVADFMNPPTVVDVDPSGYTGQPDEIIRVTAIDDFEVIKVSVRILELAGAVIEEGDAVLDNESRKWLYVGKTVVTAGQTVVLEVTAVDRPAHKAIKMVDLMCGPR